MAPASRRARLTGAGAFEAVFRRGQRSDGDFVQLVSMPAARASGRVGFVIGRKVLPRAVDRNRVRRMLRVVVRERSPAIDDLDLIVRVKRPVARGEFSQVVAEARRMLSGLPVISARREA